MTRRTFLLLPAVAGRRVLGPTGDPAPGVRVLRRWQGPFCTLRLQNRSRAPQRVREVIALEWGRRVGPETPLYAEGFQMLSQTGGTLGKPEPIGAYTDVKHYRLPEPAGAFTAYNLVHVGNLLLAFTSCRRFSGRFHLRPSSIEASLDLEGLEIGPGQTMDLEELAVFEGRDHGALFEKLAARLAVHHPPILPAQPPQGWCSWYCFGPTVTAQQVMENLEFIAQRLPALRYIQIDDGYQVAMGDWLETGKAFGGDVRAVLRQIRQRGFEPAIWVAPFIAEARSRVFQEHPGWFMKDDQKQPLASNRVTFGGWRMGPWYALDGTHPEVQRHLDIHHCGRAAI